MGTKMTLGSIFPRKKEPLTGLVVYREGRWIFSPPDQYSRKVRETPDETYYQMDVKFGITRKGAKMSSPYRFQPAQRGRPGQYLGRDKNGNYSILTEDWFRQLFPVRNQNPPHNPCNNKELRDPNYLTNIVQQQQKQSSNIQYGTSYKTGPKPTGKKKLSGITGQGKPSGKYKQ
tara:strand:+ start:24519 stop:25040 length:522 start_codon:yes stop_codon:yes gene_type:complete